MELPLGVFGVAVATVILPTLSAQSAAAQRGDTARTLDWAVRSVLLVGVPASLALIVLADPILISLFHYGALEKRDIAMASLSLRAYSIGLCAFMLVKVLAPGYYARKDMRTPVRIGITAMVANMIMNLIFVALLVLSGGAGHVGLALATSLGACLNAGLLWRGLRRDGTYVFGEQWRTYAPRLALACAAMVAMLLWLSPPVDAWFALDAAGRAVRIAAVCAGGLAVYAGLLWIAGMRLGDLRAPRSSAAGNSA